MKRKRIVLIKKFMKNEIYSFIYLNFLKWLYTRQSNRKIILNETSSAENAVNDSSLQSSLIFFT